MRLKCDFPALLSIQIIYSLTKLRAVHCITENIEKRSSFYANEAGDTVVANQFLTGLDKVQSSDQWSNKERHSPIATRFETGNFQSKFQDRIGRMPTVEQRETLSVQKSRNSKYYETDPKDEENSLEKLLRSEQRTKPAAGQKDNHSGKDPSKLVKSARKGLLSRKVSQNSRINSNWHDTMESEHSKNILSYRRRKKKKNSATPTSPTVKPSTESDNFNWDFPIFDELDRTPSVSNLKPKNQEKLKNKGFSSRKRNQAGSLSISDEAHLENSHQDHPSETSVHSRTLAERLKHRQLDMNRRKLSGLRSNSDHKPETMRRYKSDSKIGAEEKDDSIGENSRISYHRRKPYTNHRVKISDLPETGAQKVGSWDIFYSTERMNSKLDLDRSEDARSSWVVVSPTTQAKRQRQQKAQVNPYSKDSSLRRGLTKGTMRRLEDQRKVEPTSKWSSENRQDVGQKNRDLRPLAVPEVKNVKIDPKYEQKLNKNSNSDTLEKSNRDISEKSNPNDVNRSDDLQYDQDEREDNAADDPAANGHPENEWINRKQLEKLLNENQGTAGKSSLLGKKEPKGHEDNTGADQQAKSQKPIFTDDKPGGYNDRSVEDKPSLVPRKILNSKDPQESVMAGKPSPSKTAGDSQINTGARNIQGDNASQAAPTQKQNDQINERNEPEKKTGVSSSHSTTVKKSGKEIKYVVFDPEEFSATKLRAVLQEFDQPVGQIPQCSLDEYRWERAGALKNIKRREGTKLSSRTKASEATKISSDRQLSNGTNFKKQSISPVKTEKRHISFKSDIKSKRAADFKNLSDIMERLMAKGEASPARDSNGPSDAQEDRIISKYLAALMEDSQSKSKTNSSDSWLQMLLAELAENRKKYQIIHL